MNASLRNSVLFLACTMLVGCQPEKTDIVTDLYPDEQVKLQSVVREIFVAAKDKDLVRLDAFHLHSPKFTKFEESEVFTRRNIEAATKAEHDAFSAITDFVYDVQDLKVDVFGNVAITTFYFQYTAKMTETPIGGRLRGTMVFVKVNGDWKITHEHFSLFPETH